MPLPTPEYVGTSIVFRGSFNPAIFQPMWLRHQGLVSESQAEAADVEVISPQVTQYKLDTSILQVTPDLFSLTSDGEPIHDVLKDIAVGTFRILRHTPLTMVGINRSVHLRTKGEAEWHDIGHRLVPKEFWEPVTKDPGMQSVTIRSMRDDEYIGYIDITVQPSVMVSYGLYLNINDHIQIEDPSKPRDAVDMTDALEFNWTPAAKRAIRVFERVGGLL